MNDFTFSKFSVIRDNLVSKGVSAVELTRMSLANAEKHSSLNSLISLNPLALKEAEESDRLRKTKGTLSPLHGVPVVIKDLFVTKGMVTTAGSKILDGWIPPYDAEIITRLRAGGAIILAKANMDEFGMGSSNENSAYGCALNPWDPQRVPGGSSGGSAVSVAVGIAPVSFGTDTGGSIRLPAAFCGVCGLKPTYGRISRYGLIAFASSFDHVGPIASDIDGIAAALETVAGNDPKDSTNGNWPDLDFSDDPELRLDKIIVGIPKEFFEFDGVSPKVLDSLEKMKTMLSSEGVTFVEVELPRLKYAIDSYYILTPAEASSNLSRYDGIIFGKRPEVKDLKELYVNVRSNGFGSEVKRRIILGTFVLSAGYYDAYYNRAQLIRTALQQDFTRAFGKCDFIMGPVSPTLPFKIGERTDDPLSMYLQDIFTVPANLAGIPALSIPTDMIDSLPVGTQILGPNRSERKILAFARRIEKFVQFEKNRELRFKK